MTQNHRQMADGKSVSGVTVALAGLALAAVFSVFLPMLSVDFVGLKYHCTIFGISEFFSIINAFDLNNMLAAIRIDPLLDGVTSSMGLGSLLSGLTNNATLADLAGHIDQAKISAGGLDALVTAFKVLHAGAIVTLVLAAFRRSGAARAVMGVLLAAGMAIAYLLLSMEVGKLDLGSLGSLGDALTLNSSSIHCTPWSMVLYVGGMLMYASLSFLQMLTGGKERAR